jgi:hypothetical protein
MHHGSKNKYRESNEKMKKIEVDAETSTIVREKFKLKVDIGNEKIYSFEINEDPEKVTGIRIE